MPNHIMNVVTFDGPVESVEKLCSYVGKGECDADGNQMFDFNRVIPMPDEFLAGDQWYKWRCEHWGTKWNSYEVAWKDDGSVQFLTAWSHPTALFTALSAMFPDVAMYVCYADEDIGNNCDCVIYNDGQKSWDMTPFDPVELACGLWGMDVSEYHERMNEKTTDVAEFCDEDDDEDDESQNMTDMELLCAVMKCVEMYDAEELAYYIDSHTHADAEAIRKIMKIIDERDVE